MTRKDYIKLAQAIKDSQNKDELVDNIIQAFKADNDRFDERKFREAIRPSPIET